MALLTAQKISESGLTATYTAAGGSGDLLDNSGLEFLHVKNGSESGIAVTVTAQVTSVESELYGPLTKSNVVGDIAAGAEEFIGPFATAAYNNSDGQIAITYDSTTSVTIAALYLATL